MEIMDHFAYELLNQPPPPGFDPFSGSCGGGGYDGVDMEQLDDYFRAIGVLPPLPPANAHVSSRRRPQLRPTPTTTTVPTPPRLPMTTTATTTTTTTTSAPASGPWRQTRGCGVDAVARAALVPWMHDFARHFGVGQDALHRAVSYADHFLSSRAFAVTATGVDVYADDYQYQLRLLGAAAVYAASKYEDCRDTAAARTMNARDIATTCGFAASREVVDAERALLAALGYRLGGPTARTLVEHFTRRHVDVEVRRMVHAIADLSLFDHRCCLELLPSAVAAAAILLARMCLEPAHDWEQVRRWSRKLEGLTGYKPMDVYDGLECMYDMLPEDPGFDISPLLFADPIPS